MTSPEWTKKFYEKKPPIPYWLETRKGRKAWLKKYIPAVPHGSRYRLYFNTPDGPLERVPAWATYVQPGMVASGISMVRNSIRKITSCVAVMDKRKQAFNFFCNLMETCLQVSARIEQKWKKSLLYFYSLLFLSRVT